MRLFLSDSFFDKFTELPRNIQQRVRDFQRKFRENSTSAAIHLEPIAQFKDSSLRSARVDGEYRAILGSLGQDNFMLLYVDKHDLAYRWAQNKKCVWNEHTQTCQIVPVAIEEPMVKPAVEPSATTEPSVMDGIADEKLLEIGVPEELLEVVKNIKDLNDLDAAEKLLPQDAYENIFALFDDVDIEEIIEEINEGKAKEGEDSLLSINNKRRFIEITDDEYLAQIMEEGMEKWQLFLHPSQSKLVESDYRGTVKVSGSAGTGKTIAALHRLKKLCRQPHAKVLFTTFTHSLVNYLTEQAKKLKVESTRYELNNIDRVLLKLAEQFNLLPEGFNVRNMYDDDHSKMLWNEVLDKEVTEFDEEFLHAEYTDIIIYNNNKTFQDYLIQARTGRSKAISRRQRMEIWNLKVKYEALKQQRKVLDRLELFNLVTNYLTENNLHPYTNVIADEFQDFSNPELRFLRALVAEGPNDLFLTGDPYQRIYSGRKINFGAAGINIRGKRSRKLKVNYRTTEEIKKMAVSVVKGVRYDDLDGGEENNKGYISLVHGEKPQYVVCPTSADEVKKVLEYIQLCTENANIQLKDICIAARTRQLYREVENALHREGIRYCEMVKGAKNGDRDGLSLSTLHALKGLEYRVVILIGINEKSMPSEATADPTFSTMDAADKKEYLAGIRSLLYVSITRARQMVFITGFGQPTKLLEVTR